LTDDGGLLNGGENTLQKNIIVQKEAPIAQDTEVISYNITLAPNPATTYINLSNDNYSLIGSNISVYNMSGEMVLNIAGEEEDVILDISILQSGLHLIQIESSSFSMTERFMKQ
jgi:hypothetical protein